MAQVKWIKMMVDLFDNRKIQHLSTLQDGNALIVIWLQLLCLAGSINDEGLVYLTRDMPYTRQTLAARLHQPPPIVRQALKAFIQLGMIRMEDGFIQIINWQKYQNIEGLEKIKEQNRLRNIKYRQRKRLASPILTGDVTVTSHVETDIDPDKDLEEERALAAGPPRANNNFVPPSLEEVTAFCLQRGNHVNPLKFIAHYETRGWMAGRIKMRSWKSAIQAWEQNGYDKAPEEEAQEVIWAIDR